MFIDPKQIERLLHLAIIYKAQILFHFQSHNCLRFEDGDALCG